MEKATVNRYVLALNQNYALRFVEVKSFKLSQTFIDSQLCLSHAAVAVFCNRCRKKGNWVDPLRLNPLLSFHRISTVTSLRQYAKRNWVRYRTCNSYYWSWACFQIFLCLERHTNEAKGSVESKSNCFASFACQTAFYCDKTYFS